MQHPPDNGYYSKSGCRMVKKMGTVFEKNMNLRPEIIWRQAARCHSSASISCRVASPRENAVALPAAVPSLRA